MYSNAAILEEIERIERIYRNDWETVSMEFRHALEMLTENIREEAAKTSGNRGKLAILKRLMKQVKEKQGLNLYGYSQYNDSYVFCDGFRIYILNDTFGYSALETPLKVDEILLSENEMTENFKINRAAVKEFCLQEKARKKAEGKRYQASPYKIVSDKGVPAYINPIYLLDFVDMYGLDAVQCKHDSKRDYVVTPLFGYDASGRCLGCVLPIRPGSVEEV